jgi:hypothetical protein
VISILWENIRAYDYKMSESTVEKIVRAFVEQSILVVRQGVADDTKAATALWHNLMEMER